MGQDTEITPEENVVSDVYPMVHLRVRTRCSTKLQESAAPGSTLRSYLSMPVSEYNLLDPQWVQLAPNKGSTFRVTVPVNELLNIDIGPVVADVKVRQDHLRSNVTLLIEGVTFGKPDLDKKLSIRVRLVLYASGQRRNWMRLRRPSPVVDTFLEDFQDLQRIRSAGVPLPDLETKDDAEETQTTTVEKDEITLESYDTIDLIETKTTKKATTKETSSDVNNERSLPDVSKDEAEEHLIRLNSALQLRLHVAIPQVLAIVPRVIIRSAGRIILRHVLNNALPNFLALVVDDYHAWASGAPRGFKRNGLFRTFKGKNHDSNDTQIDNM